MKYLRVQLNTYEQILLLANSLTVLGKDWDEYIIIYKLIRNIPYNMLSKSQFDIEAHILSLCNTHKESIKLFYNEDFEKYAKNYFEYSKHKIKCE